VIHRDAVCQISDIWGVEEATVPTCASLEGLSPSHAGVIMGRITVGLLMFPIERSGVRPVANLLGILSSLTHERIPLVTGNAGRVFENDTRVWFRGVDHAAGGNVFSRILYNIMTQVRITCCLRELSCTDTWIFFFGGEILILPMIAAKLFRKRVILTLPAHTPTMMAPAADRLLIPARLLTRATYGLCDRIILYSPSLISHWRLEHYRNKIAIAREHLLDFGKFRVEVPLPKRPETVGYIGRLADEKGVQNFVRALPRIATENENLNFLIGGDGPLLPDIQEFIQKNELVERVTFAGWIRHEDLPGYLNSIRLLVLPSYTEGLPNIMLEAMACGTPVLATPVGAVPDFIREGETGFIMASNAPDEIATSVLDIFRCQELALVAKAAKECVEQEITYERAVELFASAIDGLRS